MILRALMITALSSLLWACGGDDKDVDDCIGEGCEPPDAMVVNPEECTAQDDYGVLTFDSSGAFVFNSFGTEIFIVNGKVGEEVEISIQLVGNIDPFRGGLMPGTFPLLLGPDTDRCGACVTMMLNGNTNFEDPDNVYFQTNGTLTIESIGAVGGENFVATLSDMTFTHALFAPMGIEPAAFNFPRPVGDGCNSAFSSASFNAPVMDL